MSARLSFQIYKTANDLPLQWDAIAPHNIFLSSAYLSALDLSAPQNMICHYVGMFNGDRLCGVAVTQFLDLNKLRSFGERDRCVKTAIRNVMFRNFSSHVLFIGNNMLTGQNAYHFTADIDVVEGLKLLKSATEALKMNFRKRGYKVHLTTFKDFANAELPNFQKAGFNRFYRFSIQPNMVFDITNFVSFDDYVNRLTKKYRDQYKRSQKRSAGITRRKMTLSDIETHNEKIYSLYEYVARNAPFNTFFLADNHFSVLKSILKDRFLFYGYFQDDQLIGFNTLIKNGDTLDTYFLGYDDTIQRKKMLYLNMLYDMIGYAIKKGYKKIVFARTALEIKSSVGAEPVEMYGFLSHQNPMINSQIDKLFKYLEPSPVWQRRSPFKD
ncbi:MAG: GNAT family N-acetyltransferase [Flavobacterium sp.]|nr:GNAT family N-acetyltransferase [Flavobacterium sp.]